MGKFLSLPLDMPNMFAFGAPQPNELFASLQCEKECIPVIYAGAGVTGHENLVREAGWGVKGLASLEAVIEGPQPSVPCCLLLDISRPNPVDLSFHRRLVTSHPEVPVICIAGDVDLDVLVRVMKAGIFDLLVKPVTEDILREVISRALQQSEVVLKRHLEVRKLRDRYASLSQRERQVMALIVSGLLNKQVGYELGISEITVKAHRGSLMRKMQAVSFAGLVKMSASLDLEYIPRAVPVAAPQAGLAR
jgi:FixJ family two-component response regulator